MTTLPNPTAVSHNPHMPHLVYDQKERIGAWVAEQVNQNADWGSFYAIGVVSGDEVLAGHRRVPEA